VRRRAAHGAPACLSSLACCAALAACGASTPLVPKGPHPAHVQEFIPVAYPPPPAQVEEIPKAAPPAGVSDAHCAWVDGHYTWTGRRWEWQPGRWVVPQAGCYYAEPVVAWSRAGEPRLYFTPPRWYWSDAVDRTEKTATCAEPRACAR
jgi:hypothetical protein